MGTRTLALFALLMVVAVGAVVVACSLTARPTGSDTTAGTGTGSNQTPATGTESGTETTPGPGTETTPPQPVVPEKKPVRLLFLGDLMLDRIPGQHIAKGEDPFGGVARLLDDADVTIGNLECVIATVGQRVPKAYNFRCHPRNVPLLARYFDAVSLANNHSGDFGKDAFAEQLELLTRGGVNYFGGGRNLEEAHRPLLIERNGLRLAILGYNEIELRSYEAGPATSGLAWSDDDRVVADIKAARQQADMVIVYPHWGLEYQSKPSARQAALARKMIDAGAALVVGSHPHVTQTVEYYKQGLIVYSLGNFVFDDYMDVPPSLNEPSRTSWMLWVTVDESGVKGWHTQTARTDDKGFPQRLSNGGPCGDGAAQTLELCIID